MTKELAVAKIDGVWKEVDPCDQDDYEEFIRLNEKALWVQDVKGHNVVTLDSEAAKEIYKMVAKLF